MSRKYTEKEWIEFLKRIGEGRSARDVCGNDKDMPTWRLVSDKLNNSIGRYITDLTNTVDIQRLQKIFITLLITFDLFIRFLQGYFI